MRLLLILGAATALPTNAAKPAASHPPAQTAKQPDPPQRSLSEIASPHPPKASLSESDETRSQAHAAAPPLTGDVAVGVSGNGHVDGPSAKMKKTADAKHASKDLPGLHSGAGSRRAPQPGAQPVENARASVLEKKMMPAVDGEEEEEEAGTGEVDSDDDAPVSDDATDDAVSDDATDDAVSDDATDDVATDGATDGAGGGASDPATDNPADLPEETKSELEKAEKDNEAAAHFEQNQTRLNAVENEMSETEKNIAGLKAKLEELQNERKNLKQTYDAAVSLLKQILQEEGYGGAPAAALLLGLLIVA